VQRGPSKDTYPLDPWIRGASSAAYQVLVVQGVVNAPTQDHLTGNRMILVLSSRDCIRVDDTGWKGFRCSRTENLIPGTAFISVRCKRPDGLLDNCEFASPEKGKVTSPQKSKAFRCF